MRHVDVLGADADAGIREQQLSDILSDYQDVFIKPSMAEKCM